MHCQIAIYHLVSVSTAAGGYRDEVVFFHDPITLSDIELRRQSELFPGNVSGELNPLMDLFGNFVHFNWIIDVSITVDPDFIVEPIKIGIDVFFPPFALNDF